MIIKNVAYVLMLMLMGPYSSAVAAGDDAPIERDSQPQKFLVREISIQEPVGISSALRIQPKGIYLSSSKAPSAELLECMHTLPDSLFVGGNIEMKGDHLSIAGTLSTIGMITLEGSTVDMNKYTVFKTNQPIRLIISNPQSLVRSIIFTPDPATYAAAGRDPVCIGAIWGRLTGLPTETSTLYFSGYKNVRIEINVDVLHTIKEAPIPATHN